VKLAFVGGAGVRIPLFVEACLRRSARIGLDEICLMDIDEQRLALIGSICRRIVAEAGDPFIVTLTTDPTRALTEASYVVTTIRAGFDAGRIRDERTALAHGVLGQETTGPAGFGMALRNVPAILAYAELLDAVSPGAWLFNFTNPAGLVVQALTDAGIERVVGVCDSANTIHRGVATWLGVPVNALRPEVFGLNHLSWTRCVRQDGTDRLASLMQDPAFIATTHLRMFEPDLLALVGMAPNEYLYYFYYAERALAEILRDERTRGEEVAAINREMLAQLDAIAAAADPEAALRAWRRAMSRREATYMRHAFADVPSRKAADGGVQTVPGSGRPALVSSPAAEHGEGYAGVALDLMEAFAAGTPTHTAVNVPNGTAIAGMAADDVVEVSCVVDASGVTPVAIGAIPEPQLLLMKSVKLYERLTVRAIASRSRTLATAALMAHPLVLSYSRARALVDEYLATNREFTGEWG
jgi:alpha-galactosidase/6-phospho-beta-glucosidase family protein